MGTDSNRSSITNKMQKNKGQTSSELNQTKFLECEHWGQWPKLSLGMPKFHVRVRVSYFGYSASDLDLCLCIFSKATVDGSSTFMSLPPTRQTPEGFWSSWPWPGQALVILDIRGMSWRIEVYPPLLVSNKRNINMGNKTLKEYIDYYIQ